MSTTTKTASFLPIPWAVTLLDGIVDKFAINPPSISKLFRWIELSKELREPEMVALIVDRDLAWVDSLDIDSFGKLAQKVNELVFPLAASLGKQSPSAAAQFAPYVRALALGLKVQSILSTPSSVSSLKPQASASAEATSAPSPTASPSADSSTS